jgi:hypothetical protein
LYAIKYNERKVSINSEPVAQLMSDNTCQQGRNFNLTHVLRKISKANFVLDKTTKERL